MNMLTVLNRAQIIEILGGYEKKGASSACLREWLEWGESSNLAQDKSLSVKLVNVLASVTVVTLAKIVASSTLSVLERAIWELGTSGAIAPDTIDLVKSLPVSKILESSEVWTLVQTGIFSESLTALATKGQKKAGNKAAGAKKRAATLAAKKGEHLKDIAPPSSKQEDAPFDAQAAILAIADTLDDRDIKKAIKALNALIKSRVQEAA